MHPIVLLLINVALCVGGLAYHFSEKWKEYRVNVAKVSWHDYIVEFPAASASSVIGTVVAFVGCYMMDWLNPPMAIACGYMGDSVMRRIVGKVMD